MRPRLDIVLHAPLEFEMGTILPNTITYVRLCSVNEYLIGESGVDLSDNRPSKVREQIAKCELVCSDYM